MNRSFSGLFLTVGLAVLLAGCAVKPKTGYLPENMPAPPDYATLDAWAAHPHKDDPSDRVPKPLAGESPLAGVDVFFIHPTTYTDKRGHTNWNGPVDDRRLNRRTDESTILFQASVFNASGRVFAPRYRQAHIHAYYSKDKTSAGSAFALAYSDVKRAFQHYLEHENEGRPFILATHSQGTTHGMALVRELIDGTPLQKQLVAAYLVGIPVPKTAFDHLPECSTAEQTQCYVSWRTYRYDYQLRNNQRRKDLTVTNPLTWSNDGAYADKSLNQGAVLRNFDRVYPAICDARAADGILLAGKPKFPGSFLFTRKNYHIADYNLFYVNIRTNARLRAEQYLNQAARR